MIEEVETKKGKIILLGTAHVSKESVEEVEETIDKYNPDTVAVELDEKRLEALKNPQIWAEKDIFKAISEGNGYRLFFNFLLSVYQRKVGEDLGLKPGEEMLKAVELAEDKSLDVELIDRDINTTLSRAMSSLSFMEKMRILSSIIYSFFEDEEIDIEELKDEDMLHKVVSEFAGRFPGLKRSFIDERDDYMVERLLQIEQDTIVAVVGAGHLEGIKNNLEERRSYSPVIEKKNRVGKVESLSSATGLGWFKTLKYGFPAVVLGLFAYGLFGLGVDVAGMMFWYWFFMNGFFAVLGGIASLAHPLTLVLSFLAAPFTSINPALPAGLVAAWVENYVRPPRVEDLQEIGSISSYGALWRNRATKLVIIFLLVNLGSSIATFLGTGVLVSLSGLV